MIDEDGLITNGIDVVVLFKRELLQRKGIVIFKPFRVIKGNLEYQEYMFIDEEGYAYHHLYERTPGNRFAFRKNLLELEEEYQTKDFEVIKEKYLEDIDKFYYYPLFWKDTDDYEIVKESKENLEIREFVDIDSKEFVDPLDLSEEVSAQESEVTDEDVSQKDFHSQTFENRNQQNFNPHKLASDIKKKVIAQNEAIETIVTNIWNNTREKGVHNNLLVIGNTGVGKTEIFRNIAKKLNMPFYQASMASFTETGYIGESVTDILAGLIMSCDGDISKAEHSIVFLDEIDKIANNSGDTYKIKSSGVQDELLKMVEDGTYAVPLGNILSEKKVMINTKNITFVGAGAFDGILKLTEKKCVGFGNRNTSKLNTYYEVTGEHLIQYGYKPEFVGRFPVVVVLDDLTKEDLIAIMKFSENNVLESQIKIFNDEGVEVKIREEVFEAIAEDAIKRKIGARGLDGAINRLFSKALYAISDSDNKCNYLEITKETVMDPSKYILLIKSKSKRRILK